MGVGDQHRGIVSRTASGSLFIALLAVAACSSTPPKTIVTTTPTVAPETASPPQGPAEVVTSPPAAHATASDAAGSQGGAARSLGMAHGNLGFRDQVSAGRTLVGLAEIDGSGGWVVVREDRAGAPGRVSRQRARRYRAVTRLDLADKALRPTTLRARTTNRYLPAGRVMFSDLVLAAWTAEVVWRPTVPLAFIRRAVTT